MILLINRKHKVKNYVKAIVIPVSSLALLVSFVLIYFAINYKASDEAKSYLNDDAVVSVTYEKSWYRFDNQSSDENGIVFYAGAKVDPVAYSPLCSQIAHQGIDVYMVKSPLYFPLLSIHNASMEFKAWGYSLNQKIDRELYIDPDPIVYDDAEAFLEDVIEEVIPPTFSRTFPPKRPESSSLFLGNNYPFMMDSWFG